MFFKTLEWEILDLFFSAPILELSINEAGFDSIQKAMEITKQKGVDMAWKLAIESEYSPPGAVQKSRALGGFTHR